MPALIPSDDAERVAALHALQILDTPPEAAYDDLVSVAAALCAMPIAIVNFVDAERHWGKAQLGVDSSASPRGDSFCARTIVAADGVLVVPDTHADTTWAHNPHVVDDPRLRFYAGAAIVTSGGHAVGSVCVADREPRRLSPGALDALKALARHAAALLELRRTSHELMAANAELHRLSVEDALTGLANRTLLRDRLTQALRAGLRTGHDVGVLFCDLDAFKAVNDRFGHQAGDDLLRVVARRLGDGARASDTVARYAGDEFVLVCPDLSAADDLAAVCARLRQSVERPVALGGATLIPRVSIGAILAGPGEDATTVLRRADAAMYAAKPASLR